MFSLKQLICHHDYEYCGEYYEYLYDRNFDIKLCYFIFKLYKCKKCGKLHKKYVYMVFHRYNIPDDVISKQQMEDNLNNEWMLNSMKTKN